MTTKRAARGESVHRTRYSGKIEWYTPSKYIDAARTCMGSIDIDPASSCEAQQIVHAEVYYTKKENGLVREWPGNVWLNPPYSQPHIVNFIDKLIGEVASGRTKNAILLTNNSTDTAWWHAVFDASQAMCFTRGRVTFVGATGSPPQGQIFSFFGKRVDEFEKVFEEFGSVARWVR